jgi:DNA-binding NarL/FixJ family response regulator
LHEAADGAGKPTVESAIASVQAGELRTKSGAAVDPSVREDARRRLAEIGIDPVPHQYIVHHAWDAGRAVPARPVLTPRERDVLRELERGSTYKQAAENLGIAWKTVQTLSHRSYGKLGASNRMAAVAEARRQGLL